ncbi:hypothetical protein HELRODRAFT_184773 [Helobdella robusta]|uniref:Uncharacterized protein n=1 Tax=Helobdella robusta TaxID=6412 RepID=T1FLY7_HELRO|nr:hypothetical protein HELRODRAFT_184773 [Helobdella robusta]ESN99484.1 hypothetical protein HELRODRAFT_184773 [Helobdella robusta]
MTLSTLGTLPPPGKVTDHVLQTRLHTLIKESDSPFPLELSISEVFLSSILKHKRTVHGNASKSINASRLLFVSGWDLFVFESGHCNIVSITTQPIAPILKSPTSYI